jgi:hypothetical protein
MNMHELDVVVGYVLIYFSVYYIWFESTCLGDWLERYATHSS